MAHAAHFTAKITAATLMRRLFGAVLVVLLVWPRAYQAVPAPATVRVLTYNIHHGEGMDGVFDLSRLAAVMEQAQPDLVALQEVDLSTQRASGVNQLAELERLTGMYAQFGKAMNFEGGDYGVAVLSRWPLLSAQNQPLPSFPNREPRTALTVRVRAGADGPLLQFTSTHLDQGREEDNRLVQAVYLNGIATGAHLASQQSVHTVTVMDGVRNTSREPRGPP